MQETAPRVDPPVYPGWGTALLALGLALALGAAASAAAAWLGRGSIEHLAATVFAGLWIGLPLAVLLAGSGILSLVHPRPAARRRLSRIALALASLLIVVGAFAASYLPGRFLNRRDVAEAQRYCRDLVAPLERMKGAQGRYPLGLEEIDAGRGERPRLLRHNFFVSDGERYSFEFDDPAGLARTYVFESGDRTWHTRD